MRTVNEILTDALREIAKQGLLIKSVYVGWAEVGTINGPIYRPTFSIDAEAKDEPPQLYSQGKFT